MPVPVFLCRLRNYLKVNNTGFCVRILQAFGYVLLKLTLSNYIEIWWIFWGNKTRRWTIKFTVYFFILCTSWKGHINKTDRESYIQQILHRPGIYVMGDNTSCTRNQLSRPCLNKMSACVINTSNFIFSVLGFCLTWNEMSKSVYVRL